MGERPDEIRRREALEQRARLGEGGRDTDPLTGRTGLDAAPDHLDATAVDPNLGTFREEGRLEVDEVEVTRVGIEHTRADMSETVDAIQRKLNPDVLKEQARDRLHEASEDFKGQAKDRVHEATVGKAKDAGSDIVEAIKQNPLPAVLTGIGLGWLLANARKQADRRPLTRPIRVHDRAYARDYPPVYRNGEEEGHSAGRALSDARDKIGETAGNAQDRAGEIAGQAQHKAEHVADQVQDQAELLGDRVRLQARRASGGFQRMLRENPLAVGALATGVGAAVGLAIPETAKENEVMGEARDDLVDKTQEKVQETQQKVRQVAEEAQGAAKQAAENQGLTQQ